MSLSSRALAPFWSSRALTLVAITLASLTIASQAQAQAPGQGPPLPAAMDLKKVPVGAWAEYSMTLKDMAPMKSRMALVSKTGSTISVEMSMEGGMLAMSGGTLVVQTVVDVEKPNDSQVKKIVMQIANNDPMEMRVEGTPQRQFQKPDPKTFVKDETIKVAAGTFKTKHYRDKTPKGDSFDFWTSPQVPPFGIVRIDTEQKSGGPGPQGPVRLELTALGKDAKMLITKPAKPMDQQAMMRQMMGGAAGAPPPAGGAGKPPVPGPMK
jgi:hypothetical protein